MKALLIATSLLFGTAAMAQDMAPGSQPMQSEATPPAPDAGMAPPPAGAPMDNMQQPGMAQPGMAQPGMSQPGAPMPAANAPGAMANAPAAGDTANYPACSRTVTDRCKNRGGR